MASTKQDVEEFLAELKRFEAEGTKLERYKIIVDWFTKNPERVKIPRNRRGLIEIYQDPSILYDRDNKLYHKLINLLE